MATKSILNNLSECAGCRSHDRINITNYQEVCRFDCAYTIYRIHCGECCTGPIGGKSPFETISEAMDVAEMSWNRRMRELVAEEIEYNTARGNA